ncbi:MAG: lipoprotein-releasing ABC transporter permease subunit [Gammaproteobacteria bacterium]
MYHPLSLFIALRYLQGRRRNRFAQFVSFASLFGIAIGVAVLVIVLSVMNGFEREVASHILGMTSHATIFRNGSPLTDWREVARRVRSESFVQGVQPFIRGSAMLNRRGEVKGVVVYGVPHDTEDEVSDLPRYLGTVSLDALRDRPGDVPVFLGATLAASLRAAPGDRATLIIPRWSPREGAGAPRYQGVTAEATFSVGMHEFDASFVLMDLPAAARLFEYGDAVSGLRLKFDTPDAAVRHARDLQRSLGAEYLVLDWSQFHRNFFQALKSQKRILFLVLSLIIAVAAFNVIASMVMLVKEKRRDIAILKTQGCRSATILVTFLVQGALLGIGGIALGALGGLVIATRADAALKWLERSFDLKLVNADVYYISYLPTEVRATDVALVALTTLLICLCATLYPAYRASQVAPVEALKYE